MRSSTVGVWPPEKFTGTVTQGKEELKHFSANILVFEEILLDSNSN